MVTTARDVARSEFGETDELVLAAERVLERQGAAGGIYVKAVLDCLVGCSEKLYAESGRGLLLLIDEMGRYVEYAVSNPSREDPSVFQQLAERSGGSRSNGLAVVGFLHPSIRRLCGHAGRLARGGVAAILGAL